MNEVYLFFDTESTFISFPSSKFTVSSIIFIFERIISCLFGFFVFLCRLPHPRLHLLPLPHTSISFPSLNNFWKLKILNYTKVILQHSIIVIIWIDNYTFSIHFSHTASEYSLSHFAWGNCKHLLVYRKTLQ